MSNAMSIRSHLAFRSDVVYIEDTIRGIMMVIRFIHFQDSAEAEYEWDNFSVGKHI